MVTLLVQIPVCCVSRYRRDFCVLIDRVRRLPDPIRLVPEKLSGCGPCPENPFIHGGSRAGESAVMHDPFLVNNHVLSIIPECMVKYRFYSGIPRSQGQDPVPFSVFFSPPVTSVYIELQAGQPADPVRSNFPGSPLPSIRRSR